MFCVIVTTRVGFDGISPSKHKQGYDIFSGTFPRSSTFKEQQIQIFYVLSFNS